MHMHAYNMSKETTKTGASVESSLTGTMYWGSEMNTRPQIVDGRKKLIGGLAGSVIDHPKTFGINLKPMDDLATSKERWFPILHAKFQENSKQASKYLDYSTA